MNLDRFIISFVVITVLFSTEILAKERVDVSSGSSISNSFPQDLQSYNDATMSVAGKLEHRISESPFNVVATLIFLLAIVHTFLSSKFMALSHAFEKKL